MKFRNRTAIWFGAAILTVAMRLLFRTLKLEFRLEQEGTNPYAQQNGECYVYCLWHDCIVIATFGGTHQKSCALTSRHSDGSFVAQVLRMVGVKPVRGSTNRIARAAVRELFQAAENQNLVISPDGPRGPNRQMSVGIVHLAACTGRAIVPTAYSCSRYWRIKGSWTDLIIPKPFSRVFLLAAKPIHVPAEIHSDGRQEYVTLLQNEMDRLEAIAENLARPKPTPINGLSDPAKDTLAGPHQHRSGRQEAACARPEAGR